MSAPELRSPEHVVGAVRLMSAGRIKVAIELPWEADTAEGLGDLATAVALRQRAHKRLEHVEACATSARDQSRGLRRVVVESPFVGEVDENRRYAKAFMRDALARGEAPLASHLLYPQREILRDELPDERALGIAAGLAWAALADATVVYVDRGVTYGMRQGIDHAIRAGRPVEYRSLYDDG
jgi:hypothetical protein